MTMTNKDRVDLGRAAVLAGTTGAYSDPQERLIDALANIIHYADGNGLAPSSAYDMALHHYLVEIGDETGD